MGGWQFSKKKALRDTLMAPYPWECLLLSFSQGIEETSLKLSANSTRRARWDAKLGYASHPHPMLVPLCSLLPDGGTVGGIDVVITRVYPLQVRACIRTCMFVYMNSNVGITIIWFSHVVIDFNSICSCGYRQCN